MKHLAGALVALALALLCAAGALLWALAPAPGDWALAVRWGGFERVVSVPALIRVGTHPLSLRALQGRRIDTRWGRLHVALQDDQNVTLRCSPCRFRVDALGSTPVELGQVVVHVHATGGGRYRGTVRVADASGTARVEGPWQAHLSERSLALTLDLPPTPIQDWVRTLAPALPELRAARIAGTASARVNVLWSAASPRGRWQVQPRLEGFVVEGLGTAALRDAVVTGCAAPAGRVQGPPARPGPDWLARAVVAAEDQRFDEHPGYDLDAWLDAWSGNQGTRTLTGASTLTQQLAKLLFTGDERSLPRKLRELLWAVEMDRTLGKARVLSLYLAVAPWGDGVCGAEAAARHYLGKPASRLTPMEAAWLASLLRNPQREVARWTSSVPSEADRAHLQHVLRGLRGIPAGRRVQLLEQAQVWRPV